MNPSRFCIPRIEALGLLLSVALGIEAPVAAFGQAPPPSGGQLQQQLILPPAPANASKPSLAIAQPSERRSANTAPIAVKVIEITGNTLLPTAQLHALVASAEGKTVTLGRLQALAERITRLYHRRGYLLARAYVPAQRIENGKVTLAVLEARYGAVRLDNHSATSDRPLRETLAPIASGAPVSEDSLDRALLLMSDIPGVIVNSTLRPGTATGTSDLDVDVTSGSRYAGLIAADDYGNRYTGRARGTGRLDVNSLLGEGDQLIVNLLTSGSGLSYGQLDYRFPLDGAGTVLGASASELYYQLSGDLAPLEARGTAQVDSVYVSNPVIRTVAGNLYLQLQYDHKDLLDRLDAADIHDYRLTNDATVTLAGDRRDAYGITNFSVAATLDDVSFENGAARVADRLGADTEGADEHYDFTLARLQQLDQHDGIYLAATGQLASRNLDPSDQFYLGGPGNARGYDVGVLTGADGYLLTAEWRRSLPLPWRGAWLASLFVDRGHLQVYKEPVTPGPNTATLADVGAGLQWDGPGQWQLSLQAATPIGPSPPLLGPTSGARIWAQIQRGF
ncbi:MAG TPA: POTRA domain-containing protein [Steroidobacteraceae bacterium]|nr:POTRA domain-containing protein [Solirubrobacteraceae bacterium]HUN25133.1 POTRA domain-containing protein [Steroidobacteraceae bacterium]